jgi:hypothetical protein
MFRKKEKPAQLKISTPYNAKRLTNGYEWPYNTEQEQDNSASEFIEMIHSARESWYSQRDPLSQAFFEALLAELDEIIEKMKMQEYDEIIKEYL